MRKLCTRQHFIEYLGYNFVEKQCLLARCTWQRYVHDFSKDGFITTYAGNGEPEVGNIEVQEKATDHIGRYKQQKAFYFDLEKGDLESWLNAPYLANPFLLVLYDVQSDIAYYLEIGDYFRSGKADYEKSINLSEFTFRSTTS